MFTLNSIHRLKEVNKHRGYGNARWLSDAGWAPCEPNAAFAWDHDARGPLKCVNATAETYAFHVTHLRPVIEVREFQPAATIMDVRDNRQ